MRSALRPLVLTCALVAAFAPAPAAAQELDAVIARVTDAWARGDVATIVSLAAGGGISLDVDGRAVGPLPARQAGAVLRRVFDDFETADARPQMARSSGGSPQRAFSQIAWTARVRGTSIGERTTVFIAYVREDGGWRISQIRLMR